MENSLRRNDDHVSTWSDSPDPAFESSDVLIDDAFDATEAELDAEHTPEPPPAAPAFEPSTHHVDEVATEYAVASGLPGRGVIVISLAASGAAAVVDFGLTGGLTMFFDLCFVTICLIGAMAVRRADLFTTGVLAPLVFGAVIAVVSVVSPTAFVESGGISRVFLTGLAVHAGALVAGYAVALATVWGRVVAART